MKDARKYTNKLLHPFLKSFGFEKRGSTWALQKPEFLIMVDLQKSQWSDIYYVNVGIQFDSLDERLPKTYRGAIKYRLVKKEGGKTKGDFSLVTDIPLIQQLIKEQVIDSFGSLNTKDEIKQVITSNPNRYLLTVKGKEVLGLSE